jgi:hypothetical protein
MMKVIVVFKRFNISKWERPTWPPSIQPFEFGINRWNILGFNFTKNALSSVYRISMVRTACSQLSGDMSGSTSPTI